ncbi:MAG TPA: hypothetical protein VGS01_13400 [Candidatus Limnocylindria bacterium]|nr:hypothetical protein [Candidatus Limnocylindria bacterium]
MSRICLRNVRAGSLFPYACAFSLKMVEMWFFTVRSLMPTPRSG